MAKLPPRVAQALRGRDLAVGYTLIVLLVSAALHAQPHRLRSHLVLQSSTNLVNLRQQPVLVLIVSAFVVPSLPALLLLGPLTAAYGAAQRWLGRQATVIVAVFGHVGATLFVAVLLATGIAHEQLSRTLARQPDVGVSYGVAAILGLLTARNRRRRLRWAVLGSAFFVLLLAVFQTFTDLGHLVAWAIGVATGAVTSAARDAEDRALGTSRPPAGAADGSAR